MTFEEYIKELRESVDGFEKQWLERNKENPDHFPMEMDEGEWDQQFLAWWQQEVF